MKILFYNWIPFDEIENKGGGVTVYTRNVIEQLCHTPDTKVYFVSSGRAYDASSAELRYEKTDNIWGECVTSYQIVNSPVASSARLSFPYPEEVLFDRTLKLVFRRLINEIGGVDVIHFQNLEGLSLSVLELKQEFETTRFVYSLHNYYAFCPQVMLWKSDEKSCDMRDTGECCLNCMPKDVFRDKVMFNQQIAYDKAHGRVVSEERLKQQVALEAECRQRIITEQRMSEIAQNLSLYRKKFVESINRWMDVVFAVSKRVKDIALDAGIDAKKLVLNYIGTVAANNQIQYVMNPYEGGRFRICYLGYPRKNKGFFFLLDALQSMSPTVLGQLSIVIAAPVFDDTILHTFDELRSKGAELIHFQGYQHEQLPEILSGVHLGIVPPIWEDNLPQVAIEISSFGIPVLCSDMGGASELSSAPGFVFKAENQSDFCEKLMAIMNGHVSMADYYKHSMKLVTMAEHVEALVRFYKG